MNTVTFYLEDDNNEEVNFNGKTLTFTLQLIKKNYKMSFQKIKSGCFRVGGRHQSGAKDVCGDITSKGVKVLIGHCSF